MIKPPRASLQLGRRVSLDVALPFAEVRTRLEKLVNPEHGFIKHWLPNRSHLSELEVTHERLTFILSNHGIPRAMLLLIGSVEDAGEQSRIVSAVYTNGVPNFLVAPLGAYLVYCFYTLAQGWNYFVTIVGPMTLFLSPIFALYALFILIAYIPVRDRLISDLKSILQET